ncbi:hypothetical protein IWW48_003698 [Coemansia sp. RSA 1200]|nr:hypothetical protein IWW48_003698 [Coemansia sp. RSA 1200]
MVSFVCDYCQNTLKKPKLDIHAQRCRYASFSCIDCGVGFQGGTYRQHTSCMTESEKYEGKNKPKKQQQQQQQKKKTNQQQSHPSAPVSSISTVDQLTKRAEAIENSTESDPQIENDTSSHNKKKRKSDETDLSTSKKIKSCDKPLSPRSDWTSTKLSKDGVSALATTITYAIHNQGSQSISFKILKKQCLELISSHPKNKLSESAAKKSFKKALIKALSAGEISLTKG